MPRRTIKAITEYKLKSGKKKYMFKAYLGLDETGKRVSVTRQGFDSYSEALTVYNKMRSKGTDNYTKPKQTTINEVWDLWFDNHKKQVKESSANKTYQLYKNHIKPYFGDLYIDKIKVAAIQKWINAKSTEIIRYHDVSNILNNLFKYGQVLGYNSSNPMDRIIVPKVSADKHKNTKNNYYDSKEQLDEFLSAAKKQNIRKYTFFKLLSSTGMRRGEALALQWSDIDFDNNIIHITKTVADGLNNKQLVQAPKTKNSVRDIPLSNSLYEALIEYRKANKIVYPLVFCKKDGSHLDLSAPANWLSYIYKANPKLKRITIHGFRHTFATLMLQPGTGNTPKDVQLLLGHENIKMTLDIYTHESEKGKNNVIKSINKLNL